MSTSGRDRVSFHDPPDENVARKKERLDSTIIKLKGKVGGFTEEHHKEKKPKLRLNTKNNLKAKSECSTSSNAESSDDDKTEGSFRIIPKAHILDVYYCMWENNCNVCWLDASMSLLAHNRTLRYQANLNGSAQIFKVIKYYNEAICTLNDQNRDETVEVKLNKAKMYLKTVQDLSLKYLQPILKYKEGDPESAFCSLFNFIFEDKNVRKYFDVNFKQSFYCEKCGRSRVTKQTKPIITLSSVEAFKPSSPTTIGECPACKEPEQKRQVIYKTLPPCLIFHFERGAGKGELNHLDFIISDREYKVTGIMTLEKANETTTMDHFISWIRDPSSDFWLECNDLNPEVLRFAPLKLDFISLNDVCIIMFEAFDELGTIEIETPLNKSKESLNEEEEDDANIPFIDLSQDTEELGCGQNSAKMGNFTVERGERHTKTTDEIDCPELVFLKSICEGPKKSSEHSDVDIKPPKWKISSDEQERKILKDTCNNSDNNISHTDGKHVLKTESFFSNESEKIPSDKVTKNISLQDTLSPKYTEMILKLAKQNDDMDANKNSNLEKKFELFQDSELQNQNTPPLVVGVSHTSQIDSVNKMDDCQSLSKESPCEEKEIINHSSIPLENGFTSMKKNHTTTKTVFDYNESSNSKSRESETEDAKCFTENHFVQKSNSTIQSMPNLDEILSFPGNVISECNKILSAYAKNESISKIENKTSNAASIERKTDLSTKEGIKDKHFIKDHIKITGAQDITKVDVFECQGLNNEPQVSVELQNKSFVSVNKFTQLDEIQHESFLKTNTRDHNIHNPSNEETSIDYESNERPPLPIEVQVEIMANDNDKIIPNRSQSEISKTQVSIKPTKESKLKQHTLLAAAKGVPKMSAKGKRKASVVPSKYPNKLRGINKKNFEDDFSDVNTKTIPKKQVVIKLVKLTPGEISNYILGNTAMQCEPITAMSLTTSHATNESTLETVSFTSSNVSISDIANHLIDTKQALSRGRNAFTTRSNRNKTCDRTVYSDSVKGQKYEEISSNGIIKKDEIDSKDDSRKFKIPTVNGKRGRKKKQSDEQELLNEKSEVLNDKKEDNLPEQSTKIPTVKGKRGRKKKHSDEQKLLNEKSEMLNDKKEDNLPEQSTKIPTVKGKRGRKKKQSDEQKLLNEKSEMLNDKKEDNLPEQSENNLGAETNIRRSTRKRTNAMKVWSDSFVIGVNSKSKPPPVHKDETLILREHIGNNLETLKVKTKMQVSKNAADVKQSEIFNEQTCENIIRSDSRRLRSRRNITKCADIYSSEMKEQTNMLETLVKNNTVIKVDKDIFKHTSPSKRDKKISSNLTISTRSNMRKSKTKITKPEEHSSHGISKNSTIKEIVSSETEKNSEDVVGECTNILINDSPIGGNKEKNYIFLNSDIDAIRRLNDCDKNTDLKEFSTNERESQVDFSSNMQKEINSSLKVENEILSGVQIHETYSLCEPIKTPLKKRMASQLQDVLAEKPGTRNPLTIPNILNDDSCKKYTGKKLKVARLSNDQSKNEMNIIDFKRRKGKDILVEPVKRLLNSSGELKLQQGKDSAQSQENIVNASKFNQKMEETVVKNSGKTPVKLNKDKRNSQESLTSLCELNFPKEKKCPGLSVKVEDFKSENKQLSCDSILPQGQTNANEIGVSFPYPSQILKEIPLEVLAKPSATQQRDKRSSQDSLLQLPNMEKSKVSPMYTQGLMAENKTKVVRTLSFNNAHEQYDSTSTALQNVKKSPRITPLHTQCLIPDKKRKVVKNLLKDMSTQLISVNKVELQAPCHQEIVGIDSEHLSASVRSQDQGDSQESSFYLSEPYPIVGKLSNISIVNVKSLKDENEARVGLNQSSTDAILFPTYSISELPCTSKEVVGIDYKNIHKSPIKQVRGSQESVLHSSETKKISQTPPSSSENIKTNTPRKRKSAIDLGIYEINFSSLDQPLKKPFISPKKLCASNVTTVDELTPKKITKISQMQCQSQSTISTDITIDKLGEVTVENLGEVTMENLGEVTVENLGEVTVENLGGVTVENFGEVTVENLDECIDIIVDTYILDTFPFLGVGSDDVKI